VDLIPDEWLADEPGFGSAEEVRSAYVAYLSARLREPRAWCGRWRRLVASLFEYALLRVVPRVERGEFINAGVVLYCQEARFLGARVHLDSDRLRALDPPLDPGRCWRTSRSRAGCARAGLRPAPWG
jgi:hypothetical protein